MSSEALKLLLSTYSGLGISLPQNSVNWSYFFTLSTTPWTSSELPTTNAETWPPSCSAAVNADNDPESITPVRCSRKTSAWGEVAVAYERVRAVRQIIELVRSIWGNVPLEKKNQE